MAISATARGSAVTQLSATSLATGSYTPTSNTLLVATIMAAHFGATTIPTGAGNGLTWFLVNSQEFDTGGTRERVTVLIALTGSGPSAGAFTASWGAAQDSGAAVLVDEYSGVDVSGTALAAIVQSALGPVDTTATSITITLGVVTSGNATIGAFVFENATVFGSPGTGYSQVQQINGGNNSPIMSEFRADAQTTVTASVSSCLVGGIGIELKAQSGSTQSVTRQIDTTIGLRGSVRKDHEYNGLTGILIGQDTFYGAPGQTKVFDAPVPLRLAQRQQPDSAMMQNLAGTLLVVSAPLFVPEFPLVRAKRLPQGFIGPSEIQLIGQDTIYADPGQVPTFGELPNPRGAAYPTGLRIYIYDEPLRDLIGQDTFYGAPGETVNPNLPIPPKGYSYPISLRTWESDEVSNNLLGQDVMYGDPGQVPTRDIPNPLRPEKFQPTLDYSPPDTLYVIVDTPFGFIDFAIPRGAKRNPADWIASTDIQLIGQDSFYGDPGQSPTVSLPNPIRSLARIPQDWIDPTEINLIGQDRIYGDPGEAPVYYWYAPWGTKYPVSLRTYIKEDITDTLLGADVVNGETTEWTVPKGPGYPLDLRTWVYDQPLKNLIGEDLVPGEITEWIVPKGQRYAVPREWLQNHSEDTLLGQDQIYGAPGQVPTYGQTPNPSGKPLPISNRWWEWDEVINNLAGQDTIYGAPGEVPNVNLPLTPRGYPYPVSLRWWESDELTGNLQGQDVIYGAPGESPSHDWPLPPKGPAYPLSNRTYAYDEPLRDLIGQDLIPGEITEWIVPKGYPFAIPLRSWQQDHITDTLLGQDVIYSAPGEVPVYDWPVPKGPARAIDLRTLTVDGTYLIGQDSMYDGPGKVPMYEWPVTHDYAREAHIVARSAHDWVWQDGQGTFLVPSNLVLPNGIQIIAMRVPDKARNPQDWQHRSDVQLVGQDTVYGDKGQVPTYDIQLPPARKVPPLANRTHIYDEPLRDLIGQDTFYGGAGQVPTVGQIPNPWGKPYPQDLRWWESDELNGNLLGQDTFYGAPGEVPARDLTQPARPTARRQPDVIQTFLGNFVSVPFGPFDLLLPVRSKPQTRDYIRPTDIQLIGQDTVYGAPGEVPNYDLTPPQRPKPRLQPEILQTFAGNFVSVPVGTVDLLLPIRLARRVTDHIRATDIQLIGQDTMYGAPGEVPAFNYPLPQRNNFKQQPDLVQTFLGQFVSVPFGPFDLLLPMRSTRRTVDYVRPTDIQLIGQDRVYGAPGEAPNYNLPLPPKGYPYPMWLRTLIDKHLTDTLRGQDQIYGDPGQVPTVSLPNPLRGPPKRIDDFIGSIIAGLNVRLPDGLQQLPARLVLPLARLRTDLVLPAQTQLIGQDRIYDGPGQVPNYNLPNPPRGYPYPLDLRTAINTYRLLVGQDSIYGGPGQVPNYEWPVPKGRPYPLDLRTLFGRFVRAGLIRVEATLDASLDIVVLKFADYTPILVRDADGNIVTILDASEETRRIYEIRSDD